MEPEDKNRYQQIARQVSVDLTPDVAVTHYDKLHEVRQVVAKICKLIIYQQLPFV